MTCSHQMKKLLLKRNGKHSAMASLTHLCRGWKKNDISTKGLVLFWGGNLDTGNVKMG